MTSTGAAVTSDLLARADRVEVLTALGSDEEAYMAAGRRVVDEADYIIAIWDGLPAAGLGGTGDVVAYARAGKRVIHVNPTTTVVRPLP